MILIKSSEFFFKIFQFKIIHFAPSFCSSVVFYEFATCQWVSNLGQSLDDYVKVLNSWLSISPSKEMREHMRQKDLWPGAGIQPTTSRFD